MIETQYEIIGDLLKDEIVALNYFNDLIIKSPDLKTDPKLWNVIVEYLYEYKYSLLAKTVMDEYKRQKSIQKSKNTIEVTKSVEKVPAAPKNLYNPEEVLQEALDFLKDVETQKNISLDSLRNDLVTLRDEKQEDPFFYWSLVTITLIRKYKRSKTLKNDLIQRLGAFIQDYRFPIYPRAKWYLQVWAKIDPEKFDYLLKLYDDFYNEILEEHKSSHIIVWVRAFCLSTMRSNPNPNKNDSGPSDLYEKLEKVMNVEDLKKLPKRRKKSMGEQFGEYIEGLPEALPGTKMTMELLPYYILIILFGLVMTAIIVVLNTFKIL